MSRKNRAKHGNAPAQAPNKSKANKQPRKQRGTLLTVLLLLILIYSIFTTWVAWTNLKADYGPSVPWVLPVLFLVSVADIVAVFAMLYWKQWGIYLYAISRTVAAVCHLILTGSMLIAIADFIPVAFVAYAIQLQHKEKLFD